MQRDGHDLGGEAEGVLHTCERRHGSAPKRQQPRGTRAPTVAMMQVNVHVKDSLVLLPQSENSQHGIVHIAEPRRFVPADRRGHGTSVSFSFLERSFFLGVSICILLSMVPASSPVDGHIALLVQKTLSRCESGAPYCRGVVEYSLHHWTVITCRDRET